MSEVQKPVVEEPVAATPAPETTTTTTETPAVAEPVVEAKPEETPAAETTTEATPEVPAAVPTEEPAAESAATEAVPAVKEATPIEEGVLGYKGPGLLKSFIFQKKFFWFGSEPVEHKNLSSYLRGEKPEVANHNAAWSSHTGKGLLYFSKKSSDKASPAGIINLSEVSDITEDGMVEFFFTIGGHKHTFQTVSLVERDNWVVTLKTKVTEAKEISESVLSSETYKTTQAALLKPAIGAATPKKEIKKEEKAEAKEEKAEAKEEKKEEEAAKKEEKAEEKKEEKVEKKIEKEEKKARKSRSASRKGDKRASIFGAIPGFGKKEEKKEEKTEAKEETAVTAPAAEEPTTTEAAPVTETAPIEAPVTTEETPAVVPTTEEATVTPVEKAEKAEKPAASKRSSIFGTLQSRFSHKKPEPEAAAPAVPAKDDEPVSETAPVIPAPEATEPLSTSTDAAVAPVETTEAPATNGETKAETAPATTKVDKRKSSLPWLNKKEKSTTTSDEEGEKPLSPFAKLRATVKGKSSPKSEKVAEKPAEKPVEPTAEAKAEDKVADETPAVEAAPATTEPTKEVEPVAAAPVPAPQVSATA